MIVSEVRRTMPLVEEPAPSGPEVMQPDPHYAGWSDDDVAAEYEKVGREHRRRRTQAEAAAVAEQAARTWLAAAGRAEGDPWVRPTGTVDAYPYQWQVSHEGGLWVSGVRGVNLREPGTEDCGWEPVA